MFNAIHYLHLLPFLCFFSFFSGLLWFSLLIDFFPAFYILCFNYGLSYLYFVFLVLFGFVVVFSHHCSFLSTSMFSLFLHQ